MDVLIEEFDGSIWAAALKDGRLEGLEVDPAGEEVRWGSIYWGKIASVNKAIDAVYVDLDGFNTGILYNADTRWRDKDGKVHKGGAEAISKRFKPGDMIAVQAKSSYVMRDSDEYEAAESKIPQLSMDITLPGRYLVFASMINENRISMRIRDKARRKVIRAMLNDLDEIQGVILRAAAADTQTDVIVREGQILKGAWEEISGYFEGDEPGIIALGPDAVQRTLSDQASQQINVIEIVTMDHYTQVEEWCSVFAPDLVTKVEPVELENAAVDLALFDHRDIIGQIEALFHSYTLLPSGGNIIIQGTAALTAIDVNKSSSKASNLTVNIEAAKEVARQIRLRNCGGIIVVDFMKHQNKKDQGKLIAALEDAVNDDPCTVQIHGITALGLIEMTRKRRTPPLEDRIPGKIEV